MDVLSNFYTINKRSNGCINACFEPITILHFNDVYNIEEQESSGGVSRFISCLQTFSQENPMVLFSGDAFNPSILSTFTKGSHMIPFLNLLNIHTACYGNHEFDFGVGQLEFLSASCNFPWLLSNLIDGKTGNPLANGLRYRLCEWQGHKIGIIGLVAKSFIESLRYIEEKDVIYQDFVEAGRELSTLLREQGATLIIALTHMRSHNDLLLAKAQPADGSGIDLILGGHDHDWYGAVQVGNTVLCKSGSDFKDLARIRIYPGRKALYESLKSDSGSTMDSIEFNSSKNKSNNDKSNLDSLTTGIKKTVIAPVISDPDSVASFDPHLDLSDPKALSGDCILGSWLGGSVVRWSRVPVEDFPCIPAVDLMVEEQMSKVASLMNVTLATCAHPLDTRYGVIRTAPTNLGNWICDLLRDHTQSDIVFLNSGTIRSDCIFPSGDFTGKDLMTMLPMMDPLCVIQLSTEEVYSALENSVLRYPELEGHFLQVSGIRFSFDPQRPEGSKILRETVYGRPRGQTDWIKLEERATWAVATKEYLREGNDGFDMFIKAPILVESDNVGHLQSIIRTKLENGKSEQGLFVIKIEDDDRIHCVNPHPAFIF